MAIRRVEAILTTLNVLLVVIILAILGSYYAMQNEGPTNNTYKIPVPKQTFQIINQMDQNANPCEDFPKFVCGNSWNNKTIFDALADEAQNQIHDLSSKFVPEGQHIVLKTAMKLFQKCLIGDEDVPNNGDDYLQSVLKAVGGWPLLKDSKWNESEFDWLQATYKLREMGFSHSQFFDLSITADPRNEGDYVFKISMPNVTEVEEEPVEEVAALLGANRDEIYSEIKEIQKFVSDMNNHSEKEEFVNIDDYQDNNIVDWREFITTIAGPTIKMSKQDMAIFPKAEELSNRLTLLASTSKRVQANYMVWKVMEEMAELKYPIFMMNICKKGYMCSVSSIYTVEERCLNMISNRFPANPIVIMYARKYIPLARLDMAKELAINIKREFFNLLDHAKWMDKVDQKNAIKKVRSMQILVGAPENYYDDHILDEMNNSLKEPSNESFLSLILQVNKNYHTFMYKQFNSSLKKCGPEQYNQRILGCSSLYYVNNTINVPLRYLQEDMLAGNMPNYFNYGGFGMIIGSIFPHIFGKCITDYDSPHTSEETFWTNKTKEAFAAQRNCLATQVEKNIKNNYQINDIFLKESFGVKLSYAAYQKWSVDRNPESTFVGLDYTPKQLFWISSARISCGTYYQNNNEREILASSQFVASLVMNNENFAKDFNCPIESKMNPLHKCNKLKFV